MNSATGLPMAESGNGWTYSGGKLTLTSGEWDFSYTHPANGAGETLSEVKCIVQINEGATVTGGTFTKVVNNGVNDRENNVSVKGGIIAGGTFKSSVNNCGGTIKAGEFTHCVNDNLGDAKGTIEGGTFASNGNFDSVTNYGIISGGTFNGLVTSYWKGVIENGTFNEKVSNYGSISGGYFLSADNKYDTASKVSGGVFKTIPSKVEDTSNLYKIQFDSESDAEDTNTLSVDNHDFGMTSVYVVGKDDTELTVTAKDKILTSVNNKANTTANSNSITFKPGEVKLDDEKEGNAYLLKLNAKIYNSELVIGADGKPVTENRKPYGDGVQGDGWTYENGTLTILTGHTESFTGPGVNKKLKVNVVVQKGAAVESGRFYKTVENHGTMSQALFCGNVTNTGDGTMKKCTFWDFEFTGNLTITITNEGEMEECIVMNDVTMLTNKGTMIRSSVGAKTVLGNGTYDTCLLAKNYGIAGTHKVTTKNETDKIMVRLVNDDGIQYYAEVEETEVYFTGTPRLKVQIGRYDDRWIRIPLTNVNGDENYGFTLSRDNFYIFAVPANSDVILNDTVKHTLTLNDAEIVNDDGTTPTSGTYVEGDKIRIRPNFGTDSEKVFDGWMSEDINVNTEIVYDDKTDNGTYILTMPGKNATVDAKYKDKAPTTYTLTVEDGYIDGNETKTSGEFEANAKIKVTAKAKTGYHFTKWTVEKGNLNLSEEELEEKLKANPLTFEMPDGALSLKANYEADTPDPVDPNPKPDPDDQPTTYTITTDSYGEVNGGASATVKENDWVHMTVAEVPEGMTFDYWDIPDVLLKALQKQNSGFRNNVENLSFQMPNMGEEEQTFAIKANFRSSELPGEDDGPSALGTMATVAVGGAAAGILVWQGVSLGVDSYLQLNLPKGVAVPANRRELVVLLWETAGKPEAALPSLYSDVPAEEIELQKATRWAIDNGLVKPADDSDASRFDPDRYVTKYDVFGAWLKLKKLMKL